MRFTWDPAKAAKNLGQNRPTFEEAKEVFAPGTVVFERQVVRNNELRWLRVGPIARGIIVVVWTEREDDTIRIISARFAKRVEREMFREYARRIR